MSGGIRPRTVFAATTAVALLLTAGGIFLLLARPGVEQYEVLARVSGKSWTRSVTAEELRTVTADSTEIPPGARWVETIPVASGRTRVVDRLGPGGAPVYRDEPVYTPRYRYQVQRWERLDTAWTLSGTVEPPAWPKPELGPERQLRDQTHSYSLTLTLPGGETRVTGVDHETFARWQVGQVVRVRVRGGSSWRTYHIIGGVESGAPGGGEVKSPGS